MTFEERVTGGQVISGLYVYPLNFVENTKDGLGREFVQTNLSVSEFRREFGVNDTFGYPQLQKQIRSFPSIDTLGHVPNSGRFQGLFLVACSDGFMYRLRYNTSPPNYEPPSTPPPPMGYGKVFKPIDPSEKVNGLVEFSSKALWTGPTTNLRNHFIDINDTGSLNYCLNVYDKTGSHDCSELQYKIIFGDYYGRGDKDLGGEDDETLTRAMYMQYKNVLLGDAQEKFEISGSEVDSVFIIDVPHKLYDDAIKIGDWEFQIGHGNISGSYSGSTDISNVEYSASVTTYIDEWYHDRDRPYYSDKSYSIYISGSQTEVGLFYPTQGVYVFNANDFGDLNVSESVDGKNPYLFYTAISGSGATSGSVGLQARNTTITYSDMIFVRAQNAEFNHSNNITWISGSEGVFRNTIQEFGTTYITTIGFFNRDKEMLAVGKISQAAQKTFSEEALFSIKLKY